MKGLLRVFLLLLLLSIISTESQAYDGGDTGRYRIISYRMLLSPHSDGSVMVDYYQKWSVTDGHIPWITVGTPNGYFAIKGYGCDAACATAQDDGNWSGVRLDLKRDYQAGETFEVRLSVLQNNVFSSDGNSYKLDFTPGWYDRAVTDSMRVEGRAISCISYCSGERDDYYSERICFFGLP